MIIDVTQGATPLTPGYAASPQAQLGNWRALQSILDNAAATNTPTVIKIPEGAYCGAKPLVIRSNRVKFVGAGTDNSALQFPTILAGIQSGTLSQSDFTTGAGKLDGTWTPKACPVLRFGKWITVPFQGFTHPSIPNQHGPGTGPDLWDQTNEFTIDIAVDFGTAVTTPASVVCFCGTSFAGKFYPFHLSLTGDYLRLRVMDEKASLSEAVCKVGPLTGVVRIAVQFSRMTGVVGWVVNKQWRADASGAVPGWTPGAKFNKATVYPFKVNGMDSDGVATALYTITQDSSYTLLGLKLSNVCRYGPTKLPGSDLATYATNDYNTLGYFPLDDDISDVVNYRFFAIQNGWATGSGLRHYGYLLDQTALSGTIYGTTFEDISLGGLPFYGQVFTQAMACDTTFKDVNFGSGGVGLGCLQVGANYYTYIQGRCSINSPLISIYQSSAMMMSDGLIMINNSPYRILWLYYSSFEFNKIFCNFYPLNSSEYFFETIASNITGNTVAIDNEVDMSKSMLRAVFRADIGQFTGNKFDVRTIGISAMPPNAAILQLDSTAIPDNQASSTTLNNGLVDIRMIRVDRYNTYRCGVDIRSNRWFGDLYVAGKMLDPRVPIVAVNTKDGTTGITTD